MAISQMKRPNAAASGACVRRNGVVSSGAIKLRQQVSGPVLPGHVALIAAKGWHIHRRGS
jgi:hypothetical protein